MSSALGPVLAKFVLDIQGGIASLFVLFILDNRGN